MTYSESVAHANHTDFSTQEPLKFTVVGVRAIVLYARHLVA
jgi:hypothetical protein